MAQKQRLRKDPKTRPVDLETQELTRLVDSGKLKTRPGSNLEILTCQTRGLPDFEVDGPNTLKRKP